MARLFCLLAMLFGLGGATPVRQAAVYSAETLLGTQGVVYLRSRLKKSKGFRAKLKRPRTVRVDLYHEVSKTFTSFSQPINANRKKVTTAYILPAGTYRLVRVAVLDDDGTERKWFLQTSDYPTVTVRTGVVSNMGEWIMTSIGDDGLDIYFKSQTNIFPLAAAAKNGSGAARSRSNATKSRAGIRLAIDAWTGETQEQAALLDPVAMADYGVEAGTVIGGYKMARNVLFSYEINLFREGRFNNLVKTGVDRKFNALSGCYGRTVKGNKTPKGKMLVSFLVSPTTMGLKNLRVQKVDFFHQRLQSCLTNELRKVRINIPKHVIGTIKFDIDVTEERVSAH